MSDEKNQTSQAGADASSTGGSTSQPQTGTVSPEPPVHPKLQKTAAIAGNIADRALLPAAVLTLGPVGILPANAARQAEWAIRRAVSEHAVKERLDKNEATQFPGSSDENNWNIIRDTVSLWDHARQKDIQATVKAEYALDHANHAEMARLAEGFQALNTRLRKARDTLGLPNEHESAPLRPEERMNLPDMPVEHKHLGETEIRTLQQFGRSLDIHAGKDNELAVAQRLEGLNTMLSRMSSEQGEEYMQKFIDNAAKDWKHVSATDKQVVVSLLTGKEAEISYTQHIQALLSTQLEGYPKLEDTKEFKPGDTYARQVERLEANAQLVQELKGKATEASAPDKPLATPSVQTAGQTLRGRIIP